MSYTGLPPKLKQAVFARDQWRCRWCGATNQPPYDVHHIRYRRGAVDDVLPNLITLCRTHHDFVHNSYEIPKRRCQEILWHLASDAGRGQTGAAIWRRPVADEESKNERPLVPTRISRLFGDEVRDGIRQAERQ